MVRVPGPLGDSGFHRESTEEEVQVKIEPRDQASSEIGSTTPPLNEARSADRQSPGRNSVDRQEVDPDPNLEEKPQLPPQVPWGTPADLDANRDLQNEDEKVKPDPYSFITPVAPRSMPKNKKSKATRKKLKAPESEAEDQRRMSFVWNEDTSVLEVVYHQKMVRKFLTQDPVMRCMKVRLIGDLKGPVTSPIEASSPLMAAKVLLELLKEAGLVARTFEANDLFDLDLAAIRSATRELFERLKLLVGETPRIDAQAPSALVGSTEVQTGSSHYASTTSEPDSDSSVGPRRMSLGLSGETLLRSRMKTEDRTPNTADRGLTTADRALRMADRAQPTTDRPKVRSGRIDSIPTTTAPADATDKLETYFQAAMAPFLKEQQVTAALKAPDRATYTGAQDVDMESVRSQRHHPSPWEYDPDDLETPSPGRIMMATATAGSGGSSLIQRVQISAISDLKESTGRDLDEDRASSWISKVKSVFLRDQAPDEEKRLTFADLLTGPAKNWYRQLSRSTRNKWSDLLREFQTQYCGLGVSVAWQYYHARKRSDESPLEYLYRLNVAGLRARLKIKDGDPKACREHVEHYIETLGDQDLADQLTLLRLADTDALEEVLRARERAKSRQKRTAFGSKYRQKASTSAPVAPAKRAVQVVQTQRPDSGSDMGSEGSDSEGDPRRIYLASAEEKHIPREAKEIKLDRVRPLRISHPQTADPRPGMTVWIGVAVPIADLGSIPILVAGRS